jgi:hypothetical protein
MSDLIGSIWKSKGRENRHVRVEKADHTYAHVRPCLPDGTDVAGGRRSCVLTTTYGVRVSLRGYRRINAGTIGGGQDA